MDTNPGEITRLLADWRAGRNDALDALTPLVYDELKVIASSYMRREAPGHTLQPTALVHEAYLRIAGEDKPALRDRSHFYAIAARLMRQILVDHARKHLSGKRGGGLKPVPLSEAVVFAPGGAADFIALDSALERLSRIDERKARAVELHYFGGLTVEETAAILNVSALTIYRDLRFAAAWMLNELGLNAPA